MLEERSCSLCWTSSTEYEFLQNDKGENKIYEVTVKYFDAMLLADEKNLNTDHIKVLCGDCWFRIIDFHDFHQEVLKTRMLFEDEKSVKSRPIEVKQENDLENEATTTQGEIFYINESVAVFNSANVKEENIEENGAISTGDEFLENIHFKRESPTILEYTEDEQLPIVIEEAECMNYTSNSHLYQNAGTVHNVTSNTTSYETTWKTSIEEADGKEKLTLMQEKTNSGHKPFRTARELNDFIAKWKPELVCELCSETANTFDQLRSHFKENHTIPMYIKCCGKKFFHRHLFANHIQLHLGPEPYTCEICGMSISSTRTLKLHKTLEHELIKQFKCDICEKLFIQKSTLDQHLLTHYARSKDFICLKCGKGFVAEQMLKYHMNRMHNPKRFCNQCGKTLRGEKAYKKHLMTHAGIKMAKFICDVCGKKYASYSGLKKHKSAYHDDGSTVYVCRVCGQLAATENALRTHKRYAHVQELKYKCIFCEKAFKSPISLGGHLATHIGKNIKCSHCPKKFKSIANMNYHRRKVHPVEWEESRKNRRQYSKLNISQVKKRIVI